MVFKTQFEERHIPDRLVLSGQRKEIGWIHINQFLVDISASGNISKNVRNLDLIKKYISIVPENCTVCHSHIVLKWGFLK